MTGLRFFSHSGEAADPGEPRSGVLDVEEEAAGPEPAGIDLMKLHFRPKSFWTKFYPRFYSNVTDRINSKECTHLFNLSKFNSSVHNSWLSWHQKQSNIRHINVHMYIGPF
jgi:hypothetical protein